MSPLAATILIIYLLKIVMPTTLHHELKSLTLELLQVYKVEPTAAHRNKLVQLNIGLVHKEAHHWVNQCTETYDDLVQVGSLGLIRAIERFDVTKGHAFSSFAIPYIRGEIQHYLRDKASSVRIPRRWQQLQRQGVRITRQLQIDLGRQPQDVEVSALLEISVDEWQEIKLAHRNREPLSLDAPMREEGDNTATLVDLLPDARYRSFQLAQEDQIRLHQSLQKLEERTREVLEFVFLQDLTQKEAAERLGISAVTVSRRMKKGLKTLRQLMVTPIGD